MAADDGTSSISVTVRVRPFTIREAAQLTKCDDGPLFLGDGSLAAVPTPKLVQKGIRPVIKVIDEKCLVFDPPEDNPLQRFSRSVIPTTSKRVKDQTFAFDRVFDENTSQADVYEATTRGLLDNVLDGYNATVFAYGATGCGKTHTITGTAQQPGIIFLAMQELFERIAERKDDKDTEVSLSYLEIYNETIRDLLVSGGSKGGLMLREDANQSVSVSGLSSHNPQNVQEVMDMIMRGNECRTMSPTEANATSSRSHAVLQINVSQRDKNADVNEPHTMATLSIIDLAGSERASATKNRGERLLEGANINRSLLALGSCINALCDPRQKNHVPYRNSKLTRLLKFSLGGNCKTVMVVCVSPSSQHFDETQNTLRYANRAKNIQTKVTRNVYNVNRHVKDFLKKIDEQMAMINELKQQQKDYEATAFSKFKKQNEKRELVARESISRLRNAYDHCLPERKDRISDMKKLRLIERRIALTSAWMTAFDKICEAREETDSLGKILAMRKTAQGILVELEGSRQHYHRRIAKTNWERAIDSAVQTGTRQLRELDGGADDSGIMNLVREAELLKSYAEREALSALSEQDKAGDAYAVQILLEAHFQSIAMVNDILNMDEDGAVQAARTILGQVLTAASGATDYIIHPDERLIMGEVFPPSRTGTPRKRKHIPGPSPLKQSMAASFASAPHVPGTPVRTSSRKRKVALVKKSVTFTPKKKTPSKRGVRWKDDVENGALAEFAKTPQKFDSTPEVMSPEPAMIDESPAPKMAAMINAPEFDSVNSSPIPPPPVPSLDVRSKGNRFLTGFLSKKPENPNPVTLNINSLASDSEHSPLRDLEPRTASNRPSIQPGALEVPPSDTLLEGIGSNSCSDSEANAWKADRADAMKIKSVIKRASSSALNSSGTMSNSSRPHRRRSPGGATSSPPSETALFTASHARRMVKGEKENISVLSPRMGAPISKSSSRRTTLGEGRSTSSREAARIAGLMGSNSGAAGGSLRGTRESASVAVGGRSIWR
ncbi:MAG: kinesin-like protein Klp5 [Peltula sp. TS41687]|nr:MAG: kinesin-like protein Klp5 [Peltula sp. TS41687]